jgi:hypothetical protein
VKTWLVQWFQIESLQIAAASDLFGDYTLNKVPIGVHEITVTYISYQTKKITGIEVKSGETDFSQHSTE